MIISVATEETLDKIILPIMIFQNPFSKFEIGQNLSPFVIILKSLFAK